METKNCKTCKKDLEIKEFEKIGNYIRLECKNCVNIKRHGKPLGIKRLPSKAREYSDNTKYCTECDKIKDRSLFRSRSKTTLSSKCIECTILKKIEKDFNISREEYLEMVKKQDNKCMICDKPETFRNRLSIDHNHSTGKVRSLLCMNCNAALGNFKDNPDLLLKAAEYLKFHQSKDLVNSIELKLSI